MKLIHLSDLHIGKRVNEVSMIEEQEYILAQIMDMIDDQRPDAVLIC
jgi:exonuclease SbcD